MNTGIYVRVSTEEQRDYGYSIEAQLRELRNYCNQRNLTIIHEYNDAGYSAKDLKRPEMERMIEDIKNGRINLVVAMKVDRLTREGYDGQWFLKFCKENNRYIKNGDKWTESRISRIINNPIYSGDLLWGIYTRKEQNQILIPNHSPAIISKELWEQCQRQKDKYNHGNHGKNIHIFHRVVRCPECHELMNSFYTIKYKNKKKKKKYNYYVRCTNKNCSKKSIVYNASKIEKELVNTLNDLSGIALLSKYSLNFPIIDNKEDIEKIKGALTKIKNDENKLLDYFLTSQIQSDVLTNRLNSLASERKELEKKKNKMESNVTFNFNKDLISLYNKDLGDIEGINPIWNILSREGKKEVIGTFVKFIDVSIDNDYNVKIENINFNNEFLQNKFYNISGYLLDKFKDLNLNIMMIIENNKFIDSLILFEKVKQKV